MVSMTRKSPPHPFAILALILTSSFAPLRAQEPPPAPTAESYLKIINEQIAAMSNTTFELSNSRQITKGSTAPVEAVLDENAILSGGGASPVSAAVETAPTVKARVHFSNLSEHWMALLDTNGRPYFEHITYPARGNCRIFHPQKEFVTNVKNPVAFGLAYSLLPLTFVEKYRSISSANPPSSVAWVVEGQTPEQVTLALRASAKVRMRATFAIPSHMCTSLRIYGENEQELESIEAVPGQTVTNLPFLAGSYKRVYNGFAGPTREKATFVTYCETTSTAPLAPGTLKPYAKPQDYQQMTEEEKLRRLKSRINKPGGTNQVPPNFPVRGTR
jgi:hypothetical protein